MPICIWNAPFDRPRVEKSLGIKIPREAVADAMDFGHLLHNAFKRKLGFMSSMNPLNHGLPMWKHLSQSDPALYSTLDAISLLRNHRYYRQQIIATGATTVHSLLHTRLDPALDFMSQKGMLVDREKHRALSVELTADLERLTAEMNAIVPESVRSPRVWTSEKNAIKGKATLVANAIKNGEPYERLEAAPLFTVKGKKKVTKCLTCGSLEVKSGHWTKKFLVKEMSDAKV